MSASTVKGDRKREIGRSPIKKKFRDSTISREDIDEAIANGIKLAFKEQQSTLDSVVTSAVRDAVDSQSQSQSQSLLYCQFCHMYRTYIQRIEIALLSYSLVHTDNTKH